MLGIYNLHASPKNCKKTPLEGTCRLDLEILLILSAAVVLNGVTYNNSTLARPTRADLCCRWSSQTLPWAFLNTAGKDCWVWSGWISIGLVVQPGGWHTAPLRTTASGVVWVWAAAKPG